jgi:hypothetical protein
MMPFLVSRRELLHSHDHAVLHLQRKWQNRAETIVSA